MTDFLAGLDLTNKRIRDAATRGLGMAGIALMRDAVMEIKTVPLKEGTLRGSGSVHVDGKLQKTSLEFSPGGEPTPNKENFTQYSNDRITALIGFNTPYAARLHEHPEFNFTTLGSGGKYLESKMNTNRDAYMNIVAQQIKRVTG